MEIRKKERPVCIRLKEEWLGNPADVKMHVWESVAKKLYQRNGCEILDDKIKAEFDKKQLEEVKEVEEPPKNKMVVRPPKSKSK